MKRYIRSSDGSYDGKYEVVTVRSEVMSKPPTEYDVISSYIRENSPKTYSSYNAALRYLKRLKGMVHRSSPTDGYYGNIPCIRQSDSDDIIAFMDYGGNLIEM